MVDWPKIRWWVTRFCSEFSASAFLLFYGCMGCVEAVGYFRLGLLEIGINFGLIVTLCLMTFGCVTGSQLTPTVTLSALTLGRIEWYWALVYTVAQILGAIAGYFLLWYFLPTVLRSDLCITSINPEITIVQAIFIEFACSSVLSLFCCAVWDKTGLDQHDTVTIRFGLCVTAIVFSMAYFTGASMNLPRSLAPALINNKYKDLWVYAVGDLPAPVLMSLLWRYFLSPSIEDKNEVVE